ncbi:hypothetical protein Q8A73_012375, partial [Channa argus]
LVLPVNPSKEAYSTWYSQAVFLPSTNQARPYLAAEIGRDRALREHTNKAQPYLAAEIGRDRALREQCGRKLHLTSSTALKNAGEAECMTLAKKKINVAKSDEIGRLESGVAVSSPGIPRRSSYQVPTRPGPIWLPRSDEIGHLESGVVFLPSTNQARLYLAAEIGRDRALRERCGRKLHLTSSTALKNAGEAECMTLAKKKIN